MEREQSWPVDYRRLMPNKHTAAIVEGIDNNSSGIPKSNLKD